METEQLKKQLQRWKLGALLALAFAVGQMSAQYFGVASAQRSVTKVQLDTSNCDFGVLTSSSPERIPAGSMLAQVIRQGAVQNTAWVYNTCR
ncbi:hypothetical protein [Deinococcus peraridilitoris]|uniref:Uncharacterized protein n=1 Tax=Deinococcus peraridilitoris (strain DSM 19664 / LMG 22246 / CIP 109416 / KR-200) TaxID=937777 RepID=L0A5U9_DEIPD|nr:hypothetical protein [Deinococcus peraridilitoris]AFZ69258.1 hypothetical protein Deipe_3836 [Deinococcus peraridilitoris DSM 19664]